MIYVTFYGPGSVGPSEVSKVESVRLDQDADSEEAAGASDGVARGACS